MKEMILLPTATIFAILLLVQTHSAKANPAESITEFDTTENRKLSWGITNDGVMGGLSRGQAEFSNEGTMIFRGTLSLENNGGFSTVRSSRTNLDLSESTGLALRVKGDGRTYQLRLATQARYRSREVSFSADFKTQEGEWIDVRVPFDRFEAGWRGRSLKNVEFDPAKITRLGILLGDKKPGKFRLEVDWLRAYNSANEATLAEIIAEDSRLKTLVSALSTAGLVEALSGDGPYTVFAPTDDAFAKLPKATATDLLKPQNRARLNAILTYHVLPEKSDLADALKTGSFATLQGNPVQVTFSEGQVKVNDTAITAANIPCSNGIIHIIDSVLIPDEPPVKTLLETAAAAGSFETLMTAVDAAGLTPALESQGPLTILAPTDAAFSALPAGTLETLLKPENREQLESILKYHTIEGRVGAGNALTAASATTLEGNPVTFTINNGLLQVNDATILRTDINCANGVIHIIDNVLLPPSKSESASAVPNDARTPAMLDSRQQITTAILRGVPLFNNGDPKACAEIYEDCIRTLAADPEAQDPLKIRLNRSLTRGKVAQSANEQAWIYRHTLDATLEYLNQQRRL